MNTKKELIIGVIGTAIIILLTFFYISQYQAQNNQNNQSRIISPAAQQSVNQSLTLTPEEISKHNLATDCWLIINNNVYAVTDYLSSHPGGASIIIPYCGQDATTAFETKDGRGSHSSTANQDLAALRLGAVNQKIENNTQTIKNNVSNIKSSKKQEKEEEDD